MISSAVPLHLRPGRRRPPRSDPRCGRAPRSLRRRRRRVGLDTALHLGRVDVLGRGLDEPGFRSDESERSVRLAAAEIVGVVPSTRSALGVQLGPVEVAVHDRRAADADLAGLALLDLVSFGVEESDPSRTAPAGRGCRADGPSAPKLTSPMTSVWPYPPGWRPHGESSGVIIAVHSRLPANVRSVCRS